MKLAGHFYFIEMEEVRKCRACSVVKNTKGFNMTLIAYRKSGDIDVQFDCGTIVTNKSYRCFLAGNIIPNEIYEKLISFKTQE